jgi:arylsulfatase A-like enzyme
VQRMTASFVHFVLGLCALFVAVGCGTKPKKDGDTRASVSQAAEVTPKASEVPRSQAIVDFGSSTAPCVFGHRGVLLDLGERSTYARPSSSSWGIPDIEFREREGASWALVRERTLVLSFVSTADKVQDASVVVEARVRGGSAKNVTAYLNGKPLGTLALTKGEIATVSARGQGVIGNGTNELMLRFSGGSKTSREVLAEFDWVRVGPIDTDTAYAAPTRADAVTTVTIGGAPKRAVSLRAPGFARCTTLVPNGSRLEGFVGVTSGEADAEVRLLVDRAEPRVLGTFHLGTRGETTRWQPLSVPLGEVGTLAAIELVARTSTKGARVAFGEVRVTGESTSACGSGSATPCPKAADSRGVVLVVLGSTPRGISLYGGGIPTPKLEALGGEGLVFDAHRATSSYAKNSVASMFTGLSPRAHGALDADSAMSPNVPSIAEAARQAGIATAMFTANPMTTTTYGITRGFETVGTQLPGVEGQATAIFEQASAWLSAHKNERFFLVVHARGGHPPWDIGVEDMMALPPRDYHGALEPKRAGEALARAKKAGGRGFSDADRERALALSARAITDHDAALGAFLAQVRALGHEKDTSWIVTSDVGVDPTARVPLLEEDSLDERVLAIPLVVVSSGDAPRGHVKAETSAEDIARTVLDALGLLPPAQLRGQSLVALASNESVAGRVRHKFAQTSTRWSLRWGGFALSATRDRTVKLCALSIDVECTNDVRQNYPLAMDTLEGAAWSELVSTQPLPTGRGERPQALAQPPLVRPSLDGPMSAALHAWGL